jgi:hypothetical protein
LACPSKSIDAMLPAFLIAKLPPRRPPDIGVAADLEGQDSQ